MANLIVPAQSDLALALREPNLLVPGRKPVGGIDYSIARPRLALGVTQHVGGTRVFDAFGRGAATYGSAREWETHHGVRGWKDTSYSSTATAPYNGSVYAAAIDVIWQELDVTATNNNRYSFLNGVSSGCECRLGSFTGLLPGDELWGLGGINGSTHRTGYISSETIYGDKRNIFVIRWNGTAYDLFWNGKALPTSHYLGGTPFIVENTGFEVAEYYDNDFVTASIQVWDKPISHSDALALSADPYCFLRPANDAPFILSVPGASGPTIDSITVDPIGQTTATATVAVTI